MSHKKKQVSEFYPEKFIKKNIFVFYGDIFSNLFIDRELIWRFFCRDFSAKYRQTLLGYFWAILMPLFTVGVFVIMNSSGLININKTSVPYMLFALIGLSVWQIFSSGLPLISNSLISAEGLITKINFNKLTILFASALITFVDFIIKLILILLLFVYFKILPTLYILFLPFFIIPLLLIILGLGMFIAFLSVIIRDMVNILAMFLTFFTFLTPIAYPLPENGIIRIIALFNPIYHLVEATRSYILYGSYKYPQLFLLSVLFAFILFILGIRTFSIVESRITERA